MNTLLCGELGTCWRCGEGYGAAMRAALDRLLGRPKNFPVELCLANGDRYLLPHPDHASVHLKTRDLVIYPDDGPFAIVVNPAQVVSIRIQRNSA